MLENLPIYIKKVTCYSVSVMALSSVAVDLGALKRGNSQTYRLVEPNILHF